MGSNELLNAVTELQELRRLQEDLEAEIVELQTRIKAHMEQAGLEQMAVGAWKIAYKAVASSRLDSSALKAALPDIAAQYTKTTVSRRFTIQ